MLTIYFWVQSLATLHQSVHLLFFRRLIFLRRWTGKLFVKYYLVNLHFFSHCSLPLLMNVLGLRFLRIMSCFWFNCLMANSYDLTLPSLDVIIWNFFEMMHTQISSLKTWSGREISKSFNLAGETKILWTLSFINHDLKSKWAFRTKW